MGLANSIAKTSWLASPHPSLPLFGDSYRVLPELSFQVGDALLVPRQYEHAPQTLQLLADLRRRLELLASTAPDMVLLDGVKQPWAAAETPSLT